MYAYELLPRLIFLTLTAEEGKMEFWGTKEQWRQVDIMEQEMYEHN